MKKLAKGIIMSIVKKNCLKKTNINYINVEFGDGSE